MIDEKGGAMNINKGLAVNKIILQCTRKQAKTSENEETAEKLVKRTMKQWPRGDNCSWGHFENIPLMSSKSCN